MRFGKKTLAVGAVLCALLFIVGYSAYANAGRCNNACTASAKTMSATTVSTSSGCPASCSAARMGMCSGASAKGTSASAGKAAAPMRAGALLPEGTMVTRVEVPGGADLLFTGTDVAAIETALRDHIGKCNAGASCEGNTCSVTTAENGVVLSVRGADPERCCAGLLSSSDTDEAGMSSGTGCPYAKSGQKAAKAAKPISTKS